MSNYWVGDDSGRVLGPVTLLVIKDLVGRGRLQRLIRASRDGTTWVGLAEVPELAQLMAPKPQAQPTSFGTEEAQLTAELARLAGKTSSEVLGLPPRATMLDARQAFFVKVKPYHPTQLPAGASDKLRQGYAQLSELLSSALAQFKPDPLPAAAAPVEAGPFGGWRRGPDQKVWIELNITPDRASIFTDVPAANIANGGFYLPCEKPLPIFEIVELRLRFQAPTRKILGSGRIVSEVNLPNKRGLGVRFQALGAEDKRFIEYFVRRSAPPPR